MNVNSRGTLKKLLPDTPANIALVQEHRLLRAERLYEASQWCVRNGWKSLWCPACETDSDTSG
eukprot:1739179-Pyramimonas_sp.AAC.1